MAKKPISESNKQNTGTVIMKFFTYSLIIWLAAAIFLMILDLTHFQWKTDKTRLCGPVESQHGFQYHLTEVLSRHPIAERIVHAMACYPLQAVIAMFLVKRIVDLVNIWSMSEASLS